MKSGMLFSYSIGDAVSRCHEHLSRLCPNDCPIFGQSEAWILYSVLSGGKAGEESSSMPSGKLTWIVVPPDLPRVMVHLPPSSLARSCIESHPTPLWCS